MHDRSMSKVYTGFAPPTRDDADVIKLGLRVEKAGLKRHLKANFEIVFFFFLWRNFSRRALSTFLPCPVKLVERKPCAEMFETFVSSCLKRTTVFFRMFK